jgi:hypothetical protein
MEFDWKVDIWLGYKALVLRAGDGDRTRDVQLGKWTVTETKRVAAFSYRSKIATHFDFSCANRLNGNRMDLELALFNSAKAA